MFKYNVVDFHYNNCNDRMFRPVGDGLCGCGGGLYVRPLAHKGECKKNIVDSIDENMGLLVANDVFIIITLDCNDVDNVGRFRPVGRTDGHKVRPYGRTNLLTLSICSS